MPPNYRQMFLKENHNGSWTICAKRDDGLGCQFVQFLFSYLVSRVFLDLPFVAPIEPPHFDHNYTGDADYNGRLYDFIGLAGVHPAGAVTTGEPAILKGKDAICEALMQRRHLLETLFQSAVWKEYKDNFWMKHRAAIEARVGAPNPDHMRVAVHIRRQNPHDARLYGNTTPFAAYLSALKHIANACAKPNMVIHFYSQGKQSSFDQLIHAIRAHPNKLLRTASLVWHLDEDVIDSFLGLCGCDAVVTGTSGFSYVPALLSQGTVHYMSFWTPPLSNWVVHTAHIEKVYSVPGKPMRMLNLRNLDPATMVEVMKSRRRPCDLPELRRLGHE